VIVLDSNILLEILERRRHYDAVIEALTALGAGELLAITTLTVSNVFYIAEKDKIGFSNIEKMIQIYRHLGVTGADVAWALAHYKGRDFEDALQVASAIREKCTAFMTLDSALAKKYGKFLEVQLIGVG
jgi:predicted nucleic acid-binding protein